MDLKKSRIHNYDLVSHNFSISMFVDFLFFLENEIPKIQWITSPAEIVELIVCVVRPRSALNMHAIVME